MPETTLRIREILRTWWPLTASWILMGFEGPAVAAVVSRLPNPTVNLAAWGGVVFPLALMVEAPIIMMLAASTALCRDWASYVKMRRFMNRLGAVHDGAPHPHRGHAALLRDRRRPPRRSQGRSSHPPGSVCSS